MAFSIHINEKVKNANRSMGQLIKTFTYMDNEMFLALYRAFIRPKME